MGRIRGNWIRDLQDMDYPDNTCDGMPQYADKKERFKVYKKNLAEDNPWLKINSESESKTQHISGLGLQDNVQNPQHYKIFPDEEVINLIRKCLTAQEFAGYCKGNILKYRLRDKEDILEDFAKSKEYYMYLSNG